MAYRSVPVSDDLSWQTAFPTQRKSLAGRIQGKIQALRPHSQEFIRLDEPAPHHAMTLAQWSHPTELRTLLATYADHIYRHHPTRPRENKPLISLWAQWYIGLLVPPLMVALLTEEAALNLSTDHFHAEFHETGRVARFWIDVRQDRHTSLLSPPARMETLVTQALLPVVNALEVTGKINGKLIWSNTGYLINGCLEEMKAAFGDDCVDTLRQTCFFGKSLSDGQDNPLWHAVTQREGQWVRRTCCQRYRLPGVQQCGDCTLK